METSKKNLKVFIQIVFISWNLHKPHTQYVGISMMHIYDNKFFWLAGFISLNFIYLFNSVEFTVFISVFRISSILTIVQTTTHNKILKKKNNKKNHNHNQQTKNNIEKSHQLHTKKY